MPLQPLLALPPGQRIVLMEPTLVSGHDPVNTSGIVGILGQELMAKLQSESSVTLTEKMGDQLSSPVLLVSTRSQCRMRNTVPQLISHLLAKPWIICFQSEFKVFAHFWIFSNVLAVLLPPLNKSPTLVCPCWKLLYHLYMVGLEYTCP